MRLSNKWFFNAGIAEFAEDNRRKNIDISKTDAGSGKWETRKKETSEF